MQANQTHRYDDLTFFFEMFDSEITLAHCGCNHSITVKKLIYHLFAEELIGFGLNEYLSKKASITISGLDLTFVA